ncbi:thiamine pyrophosphate-dependent enzyme [Halegenticoccus tardaugens]|uniref:thiamine pyrophosphate-dependent enzyme n=1 Tax=Halegenticoccus tardaugens TaxID=2071624 RepID=UPI00100AD0CD|nr:thiamine pyrophosphate-dependent enzyme [Halegenticoccus tardaugens]
MTGENGGRADQYACTAAALEATPDAAAVSNLGVSSYVLAGVDDRERNFYQWGSMGVTTSTGLGLALAIDEPVVVFEGDGSLLMSLGVLSTVGTVDPPNLTVVLWDNAVYGTTGGQPTYSATTDFAGVAESCGVSATRVESDDAFERAYREAIESDHAELIVCRVEPVEPESRPPFDFAHIKRRVRDALTGE